MILVKDKSQCCGCSSCVQRCPKGCITMVLDEGGFLHPQVDASSCIDCGLCEKVCPMLNPKLAHEPLKVFAAKNHDEAIRKESSSGGIFTMLAEGVIREGGVVFGVCWNKDWNVEQTYTDTIEGLKAFRGSKYVQSNINGSFQQAEAFLKEGRKVLCSGTPCQIAGLTHFLRKDYENLLKVECVCHSVPKAFYWTKYLDEFLLRRHKTRNDIQSISFRDKRTGWKGYSVCIKYKDGMEYLKYREQDTWMKGFIAGLTTKESCTNCPAKGKYSCADITIGDFWGVTQLAPELDDDKGLCVLVTHTQRGDEACAYAEVKSIKEFRLGDVARYNPAIVSSSKTSPKQSEFVECIKKGKSLIGTIDRLTQLPLKERVIRFLSKLKRKIIKR